MRLLLSTTDVVLISYARSILADAGIQDLMVDHYASTIEGSLPIFPRRLMVTADCWRQARAALEGAGLAHELEPESDERAVL